MKNIIQEKNKTITPVLEEFLNTIYTNEASVAETVEEQMKIIANILN